MLLGATVPVLLLSLGVVVNRDMDLYGRVGYQLYQLTKILWPASFMLLATTGIEHTGRGYAIVAIAIGVNSLLYGLVGGVLFGLRRLASWAVGARLSH